MSPRKGKAYGNRSWPASAKNLDSQVFMVFEAPLEIRFSANIRIQGRMEWSPSTKISIRYRAAARFFHDEKSVVHYSF